MCSFILWGHDTCELPLHLDHIPKVTSCPGILLSQSSGVETSHRPAIQSGISALRSPASCVILSPKACLMLFPEPGTALSGSSPLPSWSHGTWRLHQASLTHPVQTRALLHIHVAPCAFSFNAIIIIDLSVFIHPKKKSILLTNTAEFHSYEVPRVV